MRRRSHLRQFGIEMRLGNWFRAEVRGIVHCLWEQKVSYSAYRWCNFSLWPFLTAHCTVGLGIYYKISVGKGRTVSHTVRIGTQRFSSFFPPQKDTGIRLLPAMKTSNFLPSHDWRNRDIHALYVSGMNKIYHPVWQVPRSWKWTTLKTQRTSEAVIVY
jgi:hypothetical protein